MTTDTLLQRILDPTSRPNPYPLWAELRETRVAEQQNGSFMVGRYFDIVSLLHDPRVSSDKRHRTSGGQVPSVDDYSAESQLLPFIGQDPPEHDRLRRIVTTQFGPPHCAGKVDSMRGELDEIISSLVDGIVDKGRIDIVDDFAYPFPVTVICRLLGVPKEDETRFHVWADKLVAAIDPTGQTKATDAQAEMEVYMADLIEERRKNPQDDMLTGLAVEDSPEGRLSTAELAVNAIMLFIAGHETTVNLITNGTLTLLRNPDVLERLRREPELMPQAIEEMLRFEPPVQMMPSRTPIVDIELAGVTVPKGSQLILALAAGDRDPQRFEDPDRYVPDRRDNQHLSFGTGIHSCFGAPMARLEAQKALAELIRRLPNPRLVEDPPPYRPNPVLRGPRHLMVECG
jgi:cytochrome P450